MVNKQNKLVSNTKAGHKSRNLVNVDGFFSADRTPRYPFLAVQGNFKKSAVRL